MDVGEVVLADRLAAAAIVRWQREVTERLAGEGHEVTQFFVSDFSRAIAQGIWDEHPVVQAFARHRLASPATPAAREKEAARIVRWIDQATERAEKHGNTEGVWLFAKQWRVVRDALAAPTLPPVGDATEAQPFAGEAMSQLGTRCSRCGTAAPAAFAMQCNRPECEHRATPPVQPEPRDRGAMGEGR